MLIEFLSVKRTDATFLGEEGGQRSPCMCTKLKQYFVGRANHCKGSKLLTKKMERPVDSADVFCPSFLLCVLGFDSKVT